MLLFLQIAVILAACRLSGWMVHRWLRQPRVIGEMIAGVVLGPSLLGLLMPEVSQFLFPSESRPLLHAVAQLGIGLYMFLVGLDFRGDDFRSQAPSAVAVSITGIIVPFLVAVVGAPILMTVPGLFAVSLSPIAATLFLGTAIAITAFPVLARILEERGLRGSLIGTLCLSAAAIGDAIAWCALAVVLAILGAGPKIAVLAIVGGMVFSAVLLLSGPRLLAPLGRMAERAQRGDGSSSTVLAVALVLFAAAALLLASIFSKFVACWAAARLSGQDNGSSLGIGALMNARGLTELVVLNIGLSAGIIGPTLFSMLVLMAIVTTLMASPLFEWVYGRRARERGELPAL